MTLTNQAKAKLIWEHDRHRSLTDLYFFAKHVLGYTQMTYTIHKPLCQIVEAFNPIVVHLAGDRCPLSQLSSVSGAPRVSGASECGEGGMGVNFPGGTQKISQNFSPKTQEIKANRTEFLRSLVDYSNIEMGKIANYVETGEGLERLFVLHRGCFKTTIISIAHTIQLLLLWPEIRIAINSHKKEGGSQPILGAIRTHFKANEKLRALFPEYCPHPNTVGQIEFGTQDKIILPNRLSSCSWPEANIEVAGLTTDMTGRHYDYIKNDDLVTKDSVTNEAQIQKTRDFKSLQPFLFNQPEWGMTDNIGTIYHFNDLWCDLKKRPITKVLMPVWNNRDEKKILFTERFSAEGIQAIKDEIGDYEFSCQYELNPIPPESQVFKPEWLERDGFYYDITEINNIPLRISIYIDPANARNQRSDYTAWFVIGVGSYGTKFLIDIGHDKLSSEDRTNLAIDLCQKFNVHKLHYETIGFQDTDKYIINRKMRERRHYIEVIEIKASQSSKNDRIRGLQPLYERGDIRWPRNCVHHSKYHGKMEDMLLSLKDEMFMFPKCVHDDLLDVHSFMLRVDEFNAAKQKLEAPPEDKIDTLINTFFREKEKPKVPYFRFGGRILGKKSYELPARKCPI